MSLLYRLRRREPTFSVCTASCPFTPKANSLHSSGEMTGCHARRSNRHDAAILRYANWVFGTRVCSACSFGRCRFRAKTKPPHQSFCVRGHESHESRLTGAFVCLRRGVSAFSVVSADGDGRRSLAGSPSLRPALRCAADIRCGSGRACAS